MLGNLPQIMVLAVNTYNDSTEHLATCARVGILGPTQGPVGVTFSCCVLLWEGWGGCCVPGCVPPQGDCPARAQVTTVAADKGEGVQRREEQKLHNGCS